MISLLLYKRYGKNGLTFIHGDTSPKHIFQHLKNSLKYLPNKGDQSKRCWWFKSEKILHKTTANFIKVIKSKETLIV